jgi:hypothetical protein
MKVKLYCPKCGYWDNKKIDYYWLECTREEAEKSVFPFLSPELKRQSKNYWEKSVKGEVIDGVETDHLFYLVSKDLTKILPSFWQVPYSPQWGNYNPFEEIPEIELTDLREIQNIMIKEKK